jgi:hypothetical protein
MLCLFRFTAMSGTASWSVGQMHRAGASLLVHSGIAALFTTLLQFLSVLMPIARTCVGLLQGSGVELAAAAAAAPQPAHSQGV